MNLNEAYSILGLTPQATEEEVNKAFKKLALQHHPDRNKDNPDSEAAFKRINEAKQTIAKGPEEQPFQGFGGGYGGGFPGGFPDINDVLRNIHNGGESFFRKKENPELIHLKETISFKDAVLGTKINVKYKRKIPCTTCNGKVRIPQNNGCEACAGSGIITKIFGNVYQTSTCPKCHGIRKNTECSCKTGSVDTETSAEVRIPAGIQNDSTMRMHAMGNFYATHQGYTDTFVNIIVEPHEFLTFEDNKVQTTIHISLLEALKGTEKLVPTIAGDKNIIIPPLTKHKNIIKVPSGGMNIGNQIVNVYIDYPENVDSLIKSLES